MMISRAVLLFLLIPAVSADGIVVTDCEACNVHATCNVPEEAKDVIPTCSCSAGFVGDGLYCYNLTACNGGVCCGSGYSWSSEQGCVDVDECASAEEVCTSPLVCENTLGSFDCRLPEEGEVSEPSSDAESHQRSKRDANPNVNQSSLLFPCGDGICPAGLDCVAHRCQDPCTNNTPVNDPWRSTSFKRNKILCDTAVNWQGWYRLFLGGASVQMPETCVPMLRCGTNAPLWLPDPHPAPSDGIVSSHVCAHWSNNCCLFKSNPIHIKACPGNYFVYKFVKPSTCSLAYCADPNTAVCGTCKSDEACVSEDRVNWRCQRQEHSYQELVCERSFMEVGLNRAWLAGRGLNASSAHLANFRCTADNETNGVVWFRIERRGGSCGTQLRTNETHAIYSNTLLVYAINVAFSLPERFLFSCVYPLNTDAVLDVAIRPDLSLDRAVVRSGPRARAVISLYRNTNYTDPYTTGEIVLPVGSALHVGVSGEEAASDRFAVILEECYVTPSADSDDHSRFLLIQNRCPSNRRLVKMEASGPSLPGRFTALVSLFTGDYDTIFLHCSLSMCDPERPGCSQTCKSRVSRSVSLRTPLTIGPIRWEATAEDAFLPRASDE